jgi:acetoin utilization deacetylase AcuC-like enzyme
VCRKLGEVLPGLLTDYRPDLVMYDAGIDPHKGDALGRLALTDEGLHRRELMVSCRLARN